MDTDKYNERRVTWRGYQGGGVGKLQTRRESHKRNNMIRRRDEGSLIQDLEEIESKGGKQKGLRTRVHTWNIKRE